tara:strand:+ start:190 stop:414 length:225 start_codon:yes stop_codon:yes gene_type:complete
MIKTHKHCNTCSRAADYFGDSRYSVCPIWKGKLRGYFTFKKEGNENYCDLWKNEDEFKEFILDIDPSEIVKDKE